MLMAEFLLIIHPLALAAVVHTAYFTIKEQGAAETPRPVLERRSQTALLTT